MWVKQEFLFNHTEAFYINWNEWHRLSLKTLCSRGFHLNERFYLMSWSFFSSTKVGGTVETTTCMSNALTTETWGRVEWRQVRITYKKLRNKCSQNKILVSGDRTGLSNCLFSDSAAAKQLPRLRPHTQAAASVFGSLIPQAAPVKLGFPLEN